MTTKTFSALMVGFSPIKIEIEVDLNRGKPGLVIIGLPNQAIAEAKERMTASLINCGIRIRSKKTVINLAPADVKKSSSNFDLGMVVALLMAYGELRLESGEILWLGELSLSGEIKPIRGLLALALRARELGFKALVFPAAQAAEVSSLEGIELYPLAHLSELLMVVKKGRFLVQLPPVPFGLVAPPTSLVLDFSQIIGQAQAKRALEIAAAGGHNLLLEGPPGSGKSLLAKSLPTILPPLSWREALEVSQIHSLTRVLRAGLIRQRPFRSPHHSISFAGLVGGGGDLHPGEISLAHHGVLFLDEFPEFNRACLEALRQPLEDKKITLARVQGQVTYPANFTLVAAANPCRCGYYGSATEACRCTPTLLENYRLRLSGPVLDRLDLKVRVQKVPPEQLTKSDQPSGETSAVIAQRVVAARVRQTERLKTTTFHTNAQLSAPEARKYCRLDDSARQLLMTAAEKLNLSARSYFKTMMVARTIADLAGDEGVTATPVAEALSLRL